MNKKIALILTFFLILLLPSCKTAKDKFENISPEQALTTAIDDWNSSNSLNANFENPSTMTDFFNKYYSFANQSLYSPLRCVKFNIKDEKDNRFDYKNPPDVYVMHVDFISYNAYADYYNYLKDKTSLGQEIAEKNLEKKLFKDQPQKSSENRLKDEDKEKKFIADEKDCVVFENVAIKFLKNSNGDYVISCGEFQIEDYTAIFNGDNTNIELFNILSGNSLNAYIDFQKEISKKSGIN